MKIKTRFESKSRMADLILNAFDGYSDNPIFDLDDISEPGIWRDNFSAFSGGFEYGFRKLTEHLVEVLSEDESKETFEVTEMISANKKTYLAFHYMRGNTVSFSIPSSDTGPVMRGFSNHGFAWGLRDYEEDDKASIDIFISENMIHQFRGKIEYLMNEEELKAFGVLTATETIRAILNMISYEDNFGHGSFMTYGRAFNKSLGYSSLVGGLNDLRVPVPQEYVDDRIQMKASLRGLIPVGTLLDKCHSFSNRKYFPLSYLSLGNQYRANNLIVDFEDNFSDVGKLLHKMRAIYRLVAEDNSDGGLVQAPSWRKTESGQTVAAEFNSNYRVREEARWFTKSDNTFTDDDFVENEESAKLIDIDYFEATEDESFINYDYEYK